MKYITTWLLILFEMSLHLIKRWCRGSETTNGDTNERRHERKIDRSRGTGIGRTWRVTLVGYPPLTSSFSLQIDHPAFSVIVYVSKF
jgi:hypothetical protein